MYITPRDPGRNRPKTVDFQKKMTVRTGAWPPHRGRRGTTVGPPVHAHPAALGLENKTKHICIYIYMYIYVYIYIICLPLGIRGGTGPKPSIS